MLFYRSVLKFVIKKLTDPEQLSYSQERLGCVKLFMKFICISVFNPLPFLNGEEGRLMR